MHHMSRETRIRRLIWKRVGSSVLICNEHSLRTFIWFSFPIHRLKLTEYVYIGIFCLQYPEIVEPLKTTSASLDHADVTDNVNSMAELLARSEINAIGTELPGGVVADELQGYVELPEGISAIADDCTDLLRRLLDYDPQQRIRSMFKLQRIAFYMGYNFDDVKKKKVSANCISDEIDPYGQKQIEFHSLQHSNILLFSFLLPVKSTRFHGLNRNILASWPTFASPASVIFKPTTTFQLRPREIWVSSFLPFQNLPRIL